MARSPLRLLTDLSLARRFSFGRPLAGLLVLAALGCRSTVGRFSTENRLGELEFDKGRALDALRESLATERVATADLRLALEEKEAANQELARQQVAVRFLVDQNKKLVAERGEAERVLSEVRESEKRIRDQSERLKDFATTSKEELQEVRQRADAAGKERSRLLAENQTLQKQLEVSGRELEEQKGELTRTRAVVRSLQEQPSGHGGPSEGALRSRIVELEQALAKSAAEREGTAAAQLAEGSAAPASPVAAGAGSNDPRALTAGVGRLLWERTCAAFHGNLELDLFGIVALSILGWALFFPAALSFAVWRWRRARRKLARFRSGGRQADEGREAATDSLALEPTLPSLKPSHASGGEETPPKPLPRRSTFPTRADDRDFSAIISAPKAQKSPQPPRIEAAPLRAEAGPARAEAAPRPVPERERPRAERPPEGRPALEPTRRTTSGPAPALEPRKPIPARPAPLKAAAPVQPAPKSGPEEEEPAGEDDLANTQIINMGEREIGPPREIITTRKKKEPPASSDGGDKELLDELKDMINKKFDELMK
jgi:hypothetical protein